MDDPQQARRPQSKGDKPALKRFMAEQRAHNERVIAELEALRRAVEEARPVQRRSLRGIEALLRKLFLEPGELDAPWRLNAQRFGLLSQKDEDGVTLALLREAGIETSRFAEIGCGDNGGNSGFLAAELGWSGLMVDADEDRAGAARLRFNPARVRVVQSWVTRENVNELLREHGISGEIDLLSVDIDGNDYWVWEAIEACSPRLVVIECNLIFGPERSVVVPYAPDFDRHQRKPTYFGASVAAMALLGRRKGYRLVTMEPAGPNAYFLRDDVAPAVPEAAPGDVWHFPLKAIGKRKARRAEIGDPVADLYAYVEANSLPLVELDGGRS